MPPPPIVILTGAGISAESGLGTFRDTGGLWSRYDWRDLATPEGFARDPGFVLDFYNWRRARLRMAAPNAAHLALARLARETTLGRSPSSPRMSMTCMNAPAVAT